MFIVYPTSVCFYPTALLAILRNPEFYPHIPQGDKMLSACSGASMILDTLSGRSEVNNHLSSFAVHVGYNRAIFNNCV